MSADLGVYCIFTNDNSSIILLKTWKNMKLFIPGFQTIKLTPDKFELRKDSYIYRKSDGIKLPIKYIGKCEPFLQIDHLVETMSNDLLEIEHYHIDEDGEMVGESQPVTDHLLK
mgnify:FL=1